MQYPAIRLKSAAWIAVAVLAACSDVDPITQPSAKSLRGTADATVFHTATTLAVPGTIQLSSSLFTNQYHPIIWSSSDENILTVTGAGLVTAKGVGTARIRAFNGVDKEVFPFEVTQGQTSDTSAATPVDTTTQTTSGTPTTPPPPPPTGDVAGRLLGTIVTTSELTSLGGAFADYERNFVTYDEQQWAANGARWDLIDYYDRALIYYAWYRRTGDPKYLSRANAVALDYRRNYVEAAAYLIQPHWSMLDGVALHYLMTGDEASRTAVGQIADLFTGLTYRDDIGVRGRTDNRVQARYIMAVLLAHQIQAPSLGVQAGGINGGHDWATELRRALPLILGTQDADGAWRLSSCGDGGPATVHPFTTGLLMDALTRYYDLFEPDPRIPPAIRRAADYLWANDWLPGSSAFKYIERVCPSEGGPDAAPDLNNLIVSGFAWTYRMSGDPTYKQRAEAIFDGAVANAWISPTKQFNQVYSSSVRILRDLR